MSRGPLFVDYAWLENLSEGAPHVFPEFIGLGAIIDTGQARGVLHVRHETRAENVVLILEEQRRIPLVGPSFVSRNRPVDQHVGNPTVLRAQVRPGFRVTVLRAFGSDDDGAEEAVFNGNPQSQTSDEISPVK